jgi:hypothetical protein
VPLGGGTPRKEDWPFSNKRGQSSSHTHPPSKHSGPWGQPDKFHRSPDLAAISFQLRPDRSKTDRLELRFENARNRYGAVAGYHATRFSHIWAAWETVRATDDPYLDALTQERLLGRLVVNREPMASKIGTTLQRSTYHYWYCPGEASAIRQLLGHQHVPEFVEERSQHPIEYRTTR